MFCISVMNDGRLDYLEEVAGRIKRDRQHLAKVDDELSKINALLHEIPLECYRSNVCKYDRRRVSR